MEPITGRTNFAHTPLPDPDICIRLIEIETRKNDGDIRCNLTTWLRAEAPSYQAISYTWGEAASTTRIFINGEELQVRVNCEYALRQASWHRGSQYFWIDSICINQADITERSRQVARMDQVFRNAINVLACVGSHADDSELLMEFLGEHEDYLLQSNFDQFSNVTPRTEDEQMTCSRFISGIRNHLHSWQNKFRRGAPHPLKNNEVGTRLAAPHDGEHDFQELIDGSKQKRHSEQRRGTFAKGERGVMNSRPTNSQVVEERASDDVESIYIEQTEIKHGPHIDKRYLFSLWRWSLKIPSNEFCAVSKAFFSLVFRPYFSRVWVMQEVFLAPRISLCCGQHYQSMATLRGLGKGVQELWMFVFIQVQYFTKFLNLEGGVSTRLGDHISTAFWRLYFSTARIPFFRRLLPTWLIAFSEDFVKVGEGPNVIIDIFPSHGSEKKFMPLHEAIVKMRHLNCQDDRDRVYGALGCIDWEGATPVVPDYTKTTYRLALELLQVERLSTLFVKREDGQVINTITKPGISHTALAVDIARTLRISSLDTEVNAGLGLRRTEQATISILSYSENTQRLALLTEEDWFGYRISCDDSVDLASHCQHKPCILRDGNACNVGHSQVLEGIENMRRLKSANGHVIGLLPAGARSGDWVLYRRPWSRYHNHPPTLTSNIGLIARSIDASDRLLIIGQALVDDLWECSCQSPGENEFFATFSVEDLLLLQVDGGMDKGWRDLNAAEARKRLITRVCYPEGSSYVRK